MSTVDPRSVEEARQQIRALISEIEELSKTDAAEDILANDRKDKELPK